MLNIVRSTAANITQNLNVTPDATPTVDIFHEFGDTIATGITTTGSGATYTVALTADELAAAGITKLVWKYNVATVAKSQTLYINVYTPYIDATTFFNIHSELEAEWSDRFDDIEIKVRNIINTYCGQDFDFRPNKTLQLDGNDNAALFLPMRLESLSDVISNDPGPTGATTQDVLQYVQIDYESNFYIKSKPSTISSINGQLLSVSNSIFGSESFYTIVGDWGWPYVPQNVTDAAELIIEDWFNDDSAYRKHGVIKADIDRGHALQFSESVFNSTGNIDADVLLMDYTLFIMTLI